ncbi:hypothetical protein PF66_05785 [Pseudomonas asplenii]|uniref:Uncharacterized protein n=1 Tax=Pseudomonas asplenii TaxID=53407 RepID=A0A0M9GCT2_9PSED|nr:hypothetical protein PF66_05785 [Pseudomonas fuscovaginae]
MHEPAIASTRNDVNMTPIQGISIRREDQSDAVRTGIEMYGFDSDRR